MKIIKGSVETRIVQINEKIVIRRLCCLLSGEKTKTHHKDLYFGLHCAAVKVDKA